MLTRTGTFQRTRQKSSGTFSNQSQRRECSMIGSDMLMLTWMDILQGKSSRKRGNRDYMTSEGTLHSTVNNFNPDK